MKACGYAMGEKEQLSVDRTNIKHKQGHVKSDIQLMRA